MDGVTEPHITPHLLLAMEVARMYLLTHYNTAATVH